jgi:hypothetical protein
MQTFAGITSTRLRDAKIGKVKVCFTLERNGILVCTVVVTILWLAKNLDGFGSILSKSLFSLPTCSDRLCSPSGRTSVAIVNFFHE